MLNTFLQSEAAVENLIVPDSVQKARFAEAVTRLTDGEFVRGIGSEMMSWLVWTGIKFLISLAIFYICRWLLGKLLRVIDAVMTRREVELSLHRFILTAIKTLGYVLIFLIVVSILGFNSSSFVAVLASMGLAIGMALSGTLQNFAGGVMILVFLITLSQHLLSTTLRPLTPVVAVGRFRLPMATITMQYVRQCMQSSSAMVVRWRIPLPMFV